jgi:hypothetical protein
MRAAPLSGGSVTDPTYWGQPWYNPRRVRESRLSWHLDAYRSSLGGEGRIRSPGACSRVATLRESEDCACRGLVACCDPFGGCRMAPKPRTHLRCCHAPCEISRRTSGYGSRLSRETGLRPDASACLGRTSFGRCGETVSPSGGAVKTAQMAGDRIVSLSRGAGRGRCAERQRTAHASLGRHGDRGCAATAPATPNAERRPPGCQPALQLRSDG